MYGTVPPDPYVFLECALLSAVLLISVFIISEHNTFTLLKTYQGDTHWDDNTKI